MSVIDNNYYSHLLARLHGAMLHFVIVVISILPSDCYLSGEVPYKFYPDGVLRVTSVVLEPYLMRNPYYHYANGQPRFVGFIPDLLKEIAELTGLNYVIMTSPGKGFGYKRNDGTWDGMIGELIRKEADLAAAPMYRTAQRTKVVDFSIPFLDVHATLLLKKPAAGSRLAIRSVGDLLNQTDVQYGTLDRGILVRAFKSTNSTLLRLMWRRMQRFEPPAFTASNQEGIARVRSQRYAFVIPHTIGEYMAMRAPCDLVTVDRFLIDEGYRLAVGKGSELLGQFNLAIRTLREAGRLAELYRTWWLDRSECGPPRPHKIYGSAFVASSAPPQGGSSVVAWTTCLLTSALLHGSGRGA